MNWGIDLHFKQKCYFWWLVKHLEVARIVDDEVESVFFFWYIGNQSKRDNSSMRNFQKLIIWFTFDTGSFIKYKSSEYWRITSVRKFVLILHC